jgi:hypothetical protein
MMMTTTACLSHPFGMRPPELVERFMTFAPFVITLVFIVGIELHMGQRFMEASLHYGLKMVSVSSRYQRR